MTDAGRGVRIFAVGGQIDGDVQTTNVTQSNLEGYYGLVGADIQTRDWLRLGGAMGYATSEVENRASINGFATSEVDTLQLSAYAVAERGPLLGMARISAASHDAETSRYVTLAGQTLGAQGSQDADTLEASLLAAYRYTDGRLKLTPMASVTWSETEFDAGQQTGSAAAVNLADSVSTELVARLGLNVAVTGFEYGPARIAPHAYLGYASDLRDSADVVYGSFSTAPGLFSIAPGVNAGDEWGELSLGVTATLPNNLTLALSYDLVEDRKDVLSTETFSVGARLRF